MVDRPELVRGAGCARLRGTGFETNMQSESKGKLHNFKVSFVVEAREENDEDDASGKDKMPRRRSADIQGLLRTEFGWEEMLGYCI